MEEIAVLDGHVDNLGMSKEYIKFLIHRRATSRQRYLGTVRIIATIAIMSGSRTR